MHTILSWLMGISALKTVLRNLGNSQKNRRKTDEKFKKREFEKKMFNYEFFEFHSIFN